MGYLKSGRTDQHNEDLHGNFYDTATLATTVEVGKNHTNQSDGNEIPIPTDAFENVQLPVQPTAIDRIENLGKDERIEDKRLNNEVTVSGRRQPQYFRSKKVKHESNDDLVC